MTISYEDADGHEYSYESEKVKSNCVDCGAYIKGWEMHENYRMRGNYCQPCNGNYAIKLSSPKVPRL